ncbi:LacI family DNA-binding transcriptional regulator [Priestia koreensis]|uniref:LacI family DNA-binding transcriptional regulator n=1 Tax=Priestia koreensis TaxID=284581 RepID=UPI001F564A81|nr:LacI family DNA-binding transcriptional regulator [Priestia koreensis]MCM3003272.1 LacI family transcriptional regulator [Priestia koreensis]UNL86075.1 LacI family DNA-binding transcriptional regulator [Priestia koreensis]
MKKVTMKDIAKEAKVSVATVSYIINNVKNQTIPLETRNRVLEIAHRLNYAPNLAARSLVKQKTGLVGILLNRGPNETVWKELYHARFVSQLEKRLTEDGYHVLFSTIDEKAPNHHIITERKLDGVFLIDVKESNFYRISNQFTMVPIVLIDSYIEDELFFKVLPDFERAVQCAKQYITRDYVIIMEEFQNEQILQRVKAASGVLDEYIHIATSEEDLAYFLAKNKGKQVIVFNEFLATAVKNQHANEDIICVCTAGCEELVPRTVKKVTFKSSKDEIAFHIMKLLLDEEDCSDMIKYKMQEAE